MWFVLFLTFSGISLAAVFTLVYLISTMRTFVSLRKCLVSSWESRESRPDPKTLKPKSLQTPLSTRPVTAWAYLGGPQQTPPPPAGPTHTPSHPQADPSSQHQVHYSLQSPDHTVATLPSADRLQAGHTDAVKVKVAESETDCDAENLTVRMKAAADFEEKFKEYQRSLWDLQKTIPGRTPGTPAGLYPTLPVSTSGGGALG